MSVFTVIQISLPRQLGGFENPGAQVSRTISTKINMLKGECGLDARYRAFVSRL